MSGFTTGTTQHLIRSNLWTADLKEFFEDELMGQRYVKMITDFPDGDTLNIPSVGQHEVRDYEEGQAIRYTAMDTGNFTFSITEYKAAATFITEKMKQDSYYMSQLVSMFIPKQARALAVAMETDVLDIGPTGQTASNLNTINGADHRFVGSGTNETISIMDFAKARYALRKAAVPLTNLVAIVDPTVEYTLSTLPNLVNVSMNPQWEGIVRDGMSTGMQFRFNVFGWDVYVSNYLRSGLTDSMGGLTAGAGVANLFFSAAPDALPFVGAVRQHPKVDSEFNKDLQREEYVTTCRYGHKLFRPENLVVVITDTDQVA